MFPSGSFISCWGTESPCGFWVWRFVCNTPAGDNQNYTAWQRRCLHRLKARDNLLSLLPPRAALPTPDLPLECCQVSPGRSQCLYETARVRRCFRLSVRLQRGCAWAVPCARACSVCVTVSPLPHSVSAAAVQQGGPGCGAEPVSHRESTEILSESCRRCSRGTELYP